MLAACGTIIAPVALLLGPRLEICAMPRAKSRPKPSGHPAVPALANGAFGEVLTLSEAAEYLRMSADDVLLLIREHGLPGRPVGTEWRFLKSAIQDWLRMDLPLLQTNKEAWLALARKYKDDPDLSKICQEALRQRNRSGGEGE
jgi:excisionase family DNA binding protein